MPSEQGMIVRPAFPRSANQLQQVFGGPRGQPMRVRVLMVEKRRDSDNRDSAVQLVPES